MKQGKIRPTKTEMNNLHIAKDLLRKQFGCPENIPSWLRGIGINIENNNYCLQVNVKEKTAEVMKQIPLIVNGVRIIVKEVGDIIAL